MVVKNNYIVDTNSTDMWESKTHTSITFVQALSEKYVDQEELDNQFIMPRAGLITTDITFVGFGKISKIQKQLKYLTSIDLSGRSIKFKGDLEEVVDSLKRVSILNLADNDLTWPEITGILTCLPNLREVVLTGNKLNNFEDIPRQPKGRLTLLTLGRIELNWSQIIDVLSRVWREIDQLDLWNSKLCDQSMSIGMNDNHDSTRLVQNLIELKLSYNDFASLDWLLSAGKFDNLKHLDVSHCQIKIIGPRLEPLKCLNKLEVLNISHNDIEDWLSISNLNTLPQLVSLICYDNPFYIKEKMAKSFVVARLANIIKLNREEITMTMRRDSEILYLRKFADEHRDYMDGVENNFMSLHPRFDELVDLYGLPESSKGKLIDDKYITVNLCFGDRQVVKKLPCDMRVSNLQMLCKSVFKIKRPSSNISIICLETDPSRSDLNYALDKTGQSLHFFSLKNNCKLQIKIES